jgi:WXXGXW repeat (2 copies)
MLKSFRYLQTGLAPLGGLVIICTAATQLGGCVVRAAVAVPAPPPPPRVYVAPPPPPPAPVVEADVQASEPPPPLPQYEQPACPVEGYLWTPGYWAWGVGGYYWVPGTWVAPPRVGLLWTPGYWGFVGGVYSFHAGYWGPHVGFYGGVSYGFGYTGVGFAGGRWVGGAFAYNRSVTNINVTVVHNTYNETVVNNVTVNRVSYNGGTGGTAATPTAQERMAAQEPHVAATPAQHQHMQQAAANPALLARNNGGRPAIAATPHPGAFNAPGVVGAHGAGPAQDRPAVANRGYGGSATPGGAGNNAAHPTPYAAGAHPQPASGNGKPPASNPNVARSHPKPPAQKNKPAQKERHEAETAQR